MIRFTPYSDPGPLRREVSSRRQNSIYKMKKLQPCFVEKAFNQSPLFIQQELKYCQCLPCCQQPNLYLIHRLNKTQNSPGQEVCRMVELHTDDCQLNWNCCLRGFYVQLRDQKSDRIAIGKSRCRPPCYICCPVLGFLDICQPIMEIRGKENDEKLGHIQYPLWCCCFPSPSCRGLCSAIELDIVDQTGKLRFRISAPIITPGFLCCCFGGMMNMCQKRIYNIEEAQGKVVGKITNIYRSVLAQCCSKSDRFSIDFPVFSSFEDKQRLMLAAVFIDFLHYGA